jgi:hypothetical protein
MRGWRYGVPAVLALGFAFIGIVAACSVESGTITEYGLVGDGGSAAVDDSSASLDGSKPLADSGAVAKDAGTLTFDAACGNAFSAGSAIAYPSTMMKTIDGIGDDWGCEEPLVLDAANAQHKTSPDGGYGVSGECKFEWIPAALYVICDISDDTPNDGTSPQPTNNDALEVYLSGAASGSRTGNYGIFDHQFAIDYRNTQGEYANGGVAAVTGLTSAVQIRSGGYVVEAAFAATTMLSGSSLAGSMAIGFDLEIDDGVNQPESLLWAQSTHAACGACTAGCCCAGTGGPSDFPYCDVLAFGSMTLHP